MNRNVSMSILNDANRRMKEWDADKGFPPRFLLAGQIEYDLIVEQMEGINPEAPKFAPDCVIEIFGMRVFRVNQEQFFEVAG